MVGLRRRRRRAAARRGGGDRTPRRYHPPRRRRQFARQRQPREGLRRGGVCEDEGAAGGRSRRVVSAVACARCRSPCVLMHPVLQSGLTHCLCVSTTVRLTHFRPRVARARDETLLAADRTCSRVWLIFIREFKIVPRTRFRDLAREGTPRARVDGRATPPPALRAHCLKKN